jgi:hypothetical protein
LVSSAKAALSDRRPEQQLSIALGMIPLINEDPLVYDNLTKALALVTAWHESADADRALVVNTAMGYLEGLPDPERALHEAIALIAGLVSLAGSLLVELAENTGSEPEDVLRSIGQNVASHRWGPSTGGA